MAHSHTRHWVHAFWTTRNEEPLITPFLEKTLFGFMVKEFRETGCPLQIINGTTSHVHCLFLLSPKWALSDLIKHIKGTSSHFLNLQSSITSKFVWQGGYISFSVSESLQPKVYEYIKMQKTYHQRVSFQIERDEFCRLHNCYR